MYRRPSKRSSIRCFSPSRTFGSSIDDELRRRPVEPVEQVADRMQLEVLEVRVALRLGGDLGDVELVVHVAVQPEAFLVRAAAIASRASSSGIGM